MASNQGAVKAGRSFVELFADDSKLIAGLKRANAGLASFGKDVANAAKKLAVLGAAAAAGLGAAAIQFANAGSALKDMSDRTGVSVETLSELKYTADQSGTSLEALEKGLTKLAKGGATDSVAELMRLADVIANTEDETERTRIALEAFGRSGAQLIPLLMGGSAAIAQFRAKARELGLVMSTEDATAAEEFGDSIATLQTSFNMLVGRVGAEVAPALQKILDLFLEGTTAANKYGESADGLGDKLAKAVEGSIDLFKKSQDWLEKLGYSIGQTFLEAGDEVKAFSAMADNVLANNADQNEKIWSDLMEQKKDKARAAAGFEEDQARRAEAARAAAAEKEAKRLEAERLAGLAAPKPHGTSLGMAGGLVAGVGPGVLAGLEAADLEARVDDALDPFGSFAEELMMRLGEGGPPEPPELAAMTAPLASAAGTFAAAGAAGLGVTTAQERAADAAEDTAEYTRQLVEMGRNGPFVFQA
jgi:hypothetical protein